MLEYDEDEGILWVTPMLRSRLRHSSSQDIIVTIDDCDCDECVAARGGVSIDRSIQLKVPTPEGKVLIQSLSIEEANMIGRALIAYSENLDNMIEEE